MKKHKQPKKIAYVDYGGYGSMTLTIDDKEIDGDDFFDAEKAEFDFKSLKDELKSMGVTHVIDPEDENGGETLVKLDVWLPV